MNYLSHLVDSAPVAVSQNNWVFHGTKPIKQLDAVRKHEIVTIYGLFDIIHEYNKQVHCLRTYVAECDLYRLKLNTCGLAVSIVYAVQSYKHNTGLLAAGSPPNIKIRALICSWTFLLLPRLLPSPIRYNYYCKSYFLQLVLITHRLSISLHANTMQVPAVIIM